MVYRTILSPLLLAALIGSPNARPEPGQPTMRPQRLVEKLTPNRWVADVVTRVSRAGEVAAAETAGGSVTIRVRIGTDGTLEGAIVEDSSGSPALDAHALNAARAASPFVPPPEALLTLEGFTELSFAVEFRRRTVR